MERKTPAGYLVLADISGYTSFVAETESYEHLGQVEAYVRDMHVRYQEMKAA